MFISYCHTNDRDGIFSFSFRNFSRISIWPLEELRAEIVDPV